MPAVVDLAAMRDGVVALGGDPKPRSTRWCRSISSSTTRSSSTSSARPRRSQAERRSRIPAQWRALPLPQMGPGRLRQFPRRPARHRHLPPGQPGIPRPDRLDGVRRPGEEGQEDRDRRGRLSRHRGRHRFAHHHGQRPRRPRLGRRRHRGRGRHARPAAINAAARGDRVQAHRCKLKEGITATDLVLTVTQMLRKKGVVGKFVEFFGPGLYNLTLADRATIANMGPEYGATCGFFPVDAETLELSGPPPAASTARDRAGREIQRRRKACSRRSLDGQIRSSPTRSSSISRHRPGLDGRPEASGRPGIDLNGVDQERLQAAAMDTDYKKGGELSRRVQGRG